MPDQSALNKFNPDATTQEQSDDAKTKKMVLDLLDKAKKHRAKYDDRWLDFYKFFRSKQWKEIRPSYRHSEVVNLVFQTIQSVVPILTDSRPKLQFLPTEPSDAPFAEVIDKLVDYDWTRMKALDQLTEMLYDSHIYGTSFCQLYWDPKADKGLGGIDFRSADPFYCYPDPDALDVNKKCKYFIYAEPKDIKDLQREYPDHKDEIKSDIEDMDLSNLDRTQLSTVKYVTTSQAAFAYGTGFSESATDKGLKITAWISPEMSEIVEEEVKNEDGSSHFVQKRKYPLGRKITLAGGCVVEDIENPYEDGLFPYAKLCNYLLPREFWGISEVEPVEGPQKIFNKLVSFSLDVLTLMGNPVWVIDSTSGIDTDNLTSRPGLVIEKDPNSEVQRMEGVQLQPYVLQLIDRMKIWFDNITGSQDVTRGVQPVGVKAGVAIDALQEAAQTRLRQKSRLIDSMLQDVGKLWFSRIMQFYTVPRVVRITNDQESANYFKFHVENVDNGDGTVKKVANITQLEATDQGPVSVGSFQHEIKGEFDVKVSTGSTLPFARTEKLDKVLALFDRGIADAEEVLNVMEYPNKEALLQRMNEKAAQAAQAAAAQAAPQGVPNA